MFSCVDNRSCTPTFVISDEQTSESDIIKKCLSGDDVLIRILAVGDRLFDEKNIGALENEAFMTKLRALGAYADSMGISLAPLTLAYMLRVSGMGPAIPSASSLRQLESNASAGTLELSEKQLSDIAEILK